MIPGVYEEIVVYLELVSTSFNRCFHVGRIRTYVECIMNLYLFNWIKRQMMILKEDLIGMRSNRVLEMQFESKTLEEH